MSDFKIKKETKTPEYSLETLKKRKHLRKGSLLLIGIAVLTLGSCRWATQPLAGKPAMHVPKIPKSEAIAIVDSMFSNKLSIVFDHDVQINLNNSTNTIIFEADGYNSEKKISYELTEYNYPSSNKQEILDFDEIKIITNYQFESDYILMIYYAYSDGIEWSVNSFIDFYTNRMGANK